DLALTWVREHPLTAAKGWVRDGFYYVVKPDTYMTTFYTLHGWQPPRIDERLPIAMAFISIVIAMVSRRRWPMVGLLVIVVGYFLVLFMVFFPLPCYRVPLLPVFA